MEKLDEIDRLLKSIEEIQKTNSAILFPVSLVKGVQHQPVDPMHFKFGEWTKTPWEGCECLGLKISTNEVRVLCSVDRPLDMGPQEHGPWEERLVMEEGKLLEHTTGRVYTPGNGVYHIEAKEVHAPEFLEPSICLITWRQAE